MVNLLRRSALTLDSRHVRSVREEMTEQLLASPNVIAAKISRARVAEYVAGVALVKGMAQLALCEPRVTMVRSPYPLGRAGLDNPDNTYRSVRLEPGAEYVIHGHLNTARDLYIQALDAQPGEGNTLGNSLGVLSTTDLQPDRHGRFTVTLSAGSGDGRTPHLPLHPSRASVLTIRDTFGSWGESPARLALRQTAGRRAAADLNEAATRTAERTADALGFWDRYVSRLRQMPTNSVSRPASSESGGLEGQVSAFGRFELAPRSAMVLTVDAADAPYVAIQLGDNLFCSTNYWDHTSSRNLSQSSVVDGTVTYVLAERDPGVSNWIDTVAEKQGLLFLRWQGLPTGVTPAAVGVEIVDVADVAASLPDQTVTPKQRQSELKTRRMQFDRRGVPAPRF